MSSNPSDLAFDISLYTTHDLILAAEESKRICKEMERREEVRLNEIANRLFQSDDEQDQEQELNRQVVDENEVEVEDATANHGREEADQKSCTSSNRPSYKAFEKRLDDLRQFKEEHGHCIVPYTNKPLWRWCSRLRYAYGMMERGLTPPIKITRERTEALREVGFDFSVLKMRKKNTKEESTISMGGMNKKGDDEVEVMRKR